MGLTGHSPLEVFAMTLLTFKPRAAWQIQTLPTHIFTAGRVPAITAKVPFAEFDVKQEYLRADIARRYTELFLIGWLGRAFLFASPIFKLLLPAIFQLDPYQDAEACISREEPFACVDITLKESSVVSRGIPFRLRLEMADGDKEIRSVSLLGIGCDVVTASQASGGSVVPTSDQFNPEEFSPIALSPSAIRARVLSNKINEDELLKKQVVEAIVSTIFNRLSPIVDAKNRGEQLETVASEVAFVPRKEQYAREGSSEKWLQQVNEYWFAEAMLQNVRFVSADLADVTFTFYYDKAEPINSEDTNFNVNPEVIYCAFD